MTEITIQELEINFDDIMERVEEGEQFLISTDSKDFVLIPYDDYTEYYSSFNNHDDGC